MKFRKLIKKQLKKKKIVIPALARAVEGCYIMIIELIIKFKV